MTEGARLVVMRAREVLVSKRESGDRGYLISKGRPGGRRESGVILQGCREGFLSFAARKALEADAAVLRGRSLWGSCLELRYFPGYGEGTFKIGGDL